VKACTVVPNWCQTQPKSTIMRDTIDALKCPTFLAVCPAGPAQYGFQDNS